MSVTEVRVPPDTAGAAVATPVARKWYACAQTPEPAPGCDGIDPGDRYLRVVRFPAVWVAGWPLRSHAQPTMTRHCTRCTDWWWPFLPEVVDE